MWRCSQSTAGGGRARRVLARHVEACAVALGGQDMQSTRAMPTGGLTGQGVLRTTEKQCRLHSSFQQHAEQADALAGIEGAGRHEAGWFRLHKPYP